MTAYTLKDPINMRIYCGVFLAIAFIPVAPLPYIGIFGFTVNAWLGLFNMIPFGNFDGSKILKWNKIVYGCMVAAGLLMVFGRYMLN